MSGLKRSTYCQSYANDISENYTIENMIVDNYTSGKFMANIIPFPNQVCIFLNTWKFIQGLTIPTAPYCLVVEKPSFSISTKKWLWLKRNHFLNFKRRYRFHAKMSKIPSITNTPSPSHNLLDLRHPFHGVKQTMWPQVHCNSFKD